MSRLQKLLTEHPLQTNQGLMIHNPSNMFYISGYRGEGLLAITPSGNALITDSRYTEQAENETKGFTILAITNEKNHAHIAYEFFQSRKTSKVFYEASHLTVHEFNNFEKIFDNISLVNYNKNIENMRAIKDDDEIKFITQACEITSLAFEHILTQVKDGISEKDLSLEIEYFMLKNGASGIAFNTIVASGKNSSLPHAIPSDKKIEKGDFITFDFGAKKDGYCSDMTRTVSFGSPNPELLKIYQIVLDAQSLSQDMIMPGLSCKEVDYAARKYISDKGYGSYFGHGLGHSLGIDIHESPRLSQLSEDIIKVNHLLTVEPGIYLPGLGGVRIENTCLVTENGAQPLTSPTRELIIL